MGLDTPQARMAALYMHLAVAIEVSKAHYPDFPEGHVAITLRNAQKGQIVCSFDLAPFLEDVRLMGGVEGFDPGEAAKRVLRVFPQAIEGPLRDMVFGSVVQDAIDRYVAGVEDEDDADGDA